VETVRIEKEEVDFSLGRWVVRDKVFESLRPYFFPILNQPKKEVLVICGFCDGEMVFEDKKEKEPYLQCETYPCQRKFYFRTRLT